MTAIDTSPRSNGRKPTMNTMRGTLDVPYTLTAGRAAGTYLAEFANKRILGATFAGGDDIVVPAQDFLATTGEEFTGFVEVSQEGRVAAVTTTAAGQVALIRLVGASTDLLHRIVGGTVAPGDAVRAVWAEERTGVSDDLAGFEPVDSIDESAAPTPLTETLDPTSDLAYRLRLEYDHSYGPYYGTLFDQIASSRRIVGVRCPSCRSVLVPPREFCELCYVRTAEWVDVLDTGRIQGCSVVHVEFRGQRRKPPYVYIEVVLDGSATRLIHALGNVAPEAMNDVEPGARVRAVWRDGIATGSLDDIECFELIKDEA